MRFRARPNEMKEETVQVSEESFPVDIREQLPTEKEQRAFVVFVVKKIIDERFAELSSLDESSLYKIVLEHVLNRFILVFEKDAAEKSYESFQGKPLDPLARAMFQENSGLHQFDHAKMNAFIYSKNGSTSSLVHECSHQADSLILFLAWSYQEVRELLENSHYGSYEQRRSANTTNARELARRNKVMNMRSLLSSFNTGVVLLTYKLNTFYPEINSLIEKIPMLGVAYVGFLIPAVLKNTHYERLYRSNPTEVQAKEYESRTGEMWKSFLESRTRRTS